MGRSRHRGFHRGRGARLGASGHGTAFDLKGQLGPESEWSRRAGYQGAHVASARSSLGLLAFAKGQQYGRLSFHRREGQVSGNLRPDRVGPGPANSRHSPRPLSLPVVPA